MSNRNTRNVKSNGQAFFRRQAIEVQKFLAYAGGRNVKPYEVPVTVRKAHIYENPSALGGEFGSRIAS